MSPVAYTARGFADYASFVDTYGATVTVRQSSAALVDRVWLFIDKKTEPEAAPNDGAAHLSPAQARVVVAALQEWLATAEDDPEEDNE